MHLVWLQTQETNDVKLDGTRQRIGFVLNVNARLWIPYRDRMMEKNESEKKLYHSCFAFALKTFAFHQDHESFSAEHKRFASVRNEQMKSFSRAKTIEISFKYI